MLFSIIIPTYNRAQSIGDTLRSVLAQTIPDFEVIVVDDGSTDGTDKAVAAFTDKRISYYYKKNEERAVARNFGADKAKGEFLIFLDSDDRLTPEHLAQVKNYLDRHGMRPPFLLSGYSTLNAKGEVIYKYSQRGIFDREKLIFANYLTCISVTIRASIFRQYYFNTSRDLIVFEDWELWLRVISDHELHCLPQITVLISNHEGRSVLSPDYRNLIRKLYFLRDHVIANIPLVNHSRRTRNLFRTGVYSYAALHIALNKNNRALALKFLLKSVWHTPGFIFKRRFAGILKQLF